MSDSGDSDIAWIFYKDRPDWSDVTPVPEDDGPTPVVVIAHSEKFEDVYDYFRAVLQKNEISERALHLTKDAVELNPANYTVWQYRRDLLKELNTNLRSELDYVESVIKQSPKNYQVWHHRRMLVEWLQDPSLELDLTGDSLIQDPKNYHAWQHRQWVMKAFGLEQYDILAANGLSMLVPPSAIDREISSLFPLCLLPKCDVMMQLKEGPAHLSPPCCMCKGSPAFKQLFDNEMDFVDNLLTDDVRNNSAWNQRYFVMNNHLGWSDLNVQREICYTLEKIKFVKNNESAWNYLRGVLLHDKRGLGGNAVVLSFCEDLFKNRCRSPYLLAFIVDICDEAIKKGETNSIYCADRAIELCQALSNKYDRIRSKYWNYLSENFKKTQHIENGSANNHV